MSLSKEKYDRKNLNVIKVNSVPARMKIADYRSFLEEIDADKVLKFDAENSVARERSEDDFEKFGRADGSSRNEVTIAYEEGFEAGKTEATKLLQAEYEKKVEGIVGDFVAMVHEFSGEIEKYNREYDKAIVTLALAVARRLVAREIALDESAVLARSREAIRKIIGVERIKIHINPSDEEYIREHRNDLSSYADSVKEIAIESDNKVERGGCIIESELGNIDARISTQFDLIEEAFSELAK
ncbi:MAG TPA: FliH/SctL family protein [Candidatus Acidoferrales bacterium]|nr:FliH/SctL family protein [Candidatus Acidoferrales bacterium]